MILSKRLRAVTDILPPGNSVADIGCDHGYISITLVDTGKYNKAIAMDVRKGPLSIARENIDKLGFSSKIETRLSDGFEQLNVGEADSAVIAGMGGLLAIGIIERELEIVQNMKYLLVQPQSDVNLVRQFLRDNKFATVDEDIVFDDGKYYPMFLVQYIGKEASTCNSAFEQDMYDYYGELLINRKNTVLLEYLLHEQDVFNTVLEKLPAENLERRNTITYRLKMIKEAIKRIKE